MSICTSTKSSSRRARISGLWVASRLAGGLALALGLPGASAATAPAAPAPPSLIVVPSTLASQNATIEPSGVAWAGPIDRYLVVSDDTGNETDKHEPWVFAMTRQGAFDATPVPILGVKELNDPESICDGPDGTFFLTTSHSLNKKGHLKPARRRLLHLKLEGRALRALGMIDLTTVVDARGAGILSIAGLDPSGMLDIEALTYQKDALLIGLKAPLTAHGDAVILRLSSPVQALHLGRVEPGALTLFRQVPLGVSRPKGTIGRGISDMTGLPDGSIVLLANSPKGAPSDGGGGIYWLKPGASAPLLLHDFPGLKPEGVTKAADGKGFVLVFDNDFRPPLWARWPFPQ
jgi:hypothetical protein